MSEFTKSGLVNFVKKIEIPLAIISVCFFSVFIVNYFLTDDSNSLIIENTNNPDLEYYKSKLSELYDKVELFKSDLDKYGETDEVKKEYVSITKLHSDFSTKISQHNANYPDKLVLPSLEDIKTLSLDKLYVIMFNN